MCCPQPRCTKRMPLIHLVSFEIALYSKMVLLTVVTNSNPHRLYFDHPIEKPSYIRLLSASLYNSWHNLKEEAVIYANDPNRTPLEAKLLPGHYTVDSLVKEFNDLSANNQKFIITAKAHTTVGSMIINGGNTRFSHGLLQLLGIQSLSSITFVKRLTSPSTYFVHCDLIDKRQNRLNGKPSTVLARLDIRGQPFEKVHYQTPQPHVLRDTDSGDYDVNSITLSVQDENGNLFDFNNQPLEFEVEIN